MLSYQACISWRKDIKNLISTNYRQPLWTLPAKTLCPKESGLPLFPLQPPCFRGYCIFGSVHDDAFHDDCGREVRRTSEDSFLTNYKPCVLCSNLPVILWDKTSLKYCLRKAPWHSGRSRVQRCFSDYKTTECVTGVHNRVTERRTIYLAAEHYQTSYTTVTDYSPKKNPLTMACATKTKLPTGISSKGKYTTSTRGVRNRNYLNYLLSEFSMQCLYWNQNTLLARNPFWPVHGGELQNSKASKKKQLDKFDATCWTWFSEHQTNLLETNPGGLKACVQLR